mmetsp:Transcript_9254/g.27849  ORF Transcript_9254/g.27849 Transcript_9254/m.27849 type:complete len:123 (+) Transcript_9254:110-478(+)|eukprot:CAMPEP_0198722622 /NCGR_PEP_ID=MMETSP1475-20131203/281_1 /TAXON_ID= ORGANISM="Unidentified sp., Strain CCMP1999" /NCGR_SAMPLE_ID=MMETSP1475 /ASSEMBLY_ACC=CAM_ASM_001111 /LENGTH=122 /DNA_ID=CAMNT_0044483533 /DNA_START=68 /DNA_END=436 /DNA_ORIENTATION=+
MATAELEPILEQRDKASEKLMALKTEMKQLESEVEALEEKEKEGKNRDQLLRKCRELNERVTQNTLKVDGVEVSRDLAAAALKLGKREVAKELAVLLIRRKGCVKDLLELGSRIEAVENKLK